MRPKYGKNGNLIKYLNLVQEKLKKFNQTEIKHVLHKQNTRADILSKLASTRKKVGNKFVIQELLSHPSIERSTMLLNINAIRDDT